MTIRKTSGLVVLAAVLLLPLSVGAATYTTTTGSVNATVGTPVVHIEANGSTGASTSDTGTATGSDAGLTGGLHTNGLGVEVMSSSQVTSDADLKVFADNLKTRDANVATAEADSSGSADLEYYHKGRLFGFIPVRVKTHTWVTTDTDGSLKVNTTMPWWNMFVAGTGKIRGEVDDSLSNSASVATDIHASADASARARLLQAIANAHANLDASASGSTSTSY